VSGIVGVPVIILMTGTKAATSQRFFSGTNLSCQVKI